MSWLVLPEKEEWVFSHTLITQGKLKDPQLCLDCVSDFLILSCHYLLKVLKLMSTTPDMLTAQ